MSQRFGPPAITGCVNIQPWKKVPESTTDNPLRRGIFEAKLEILGRLGGEYQTILVEAAKRGESPVLDHLTDDERRWMEQRIQSSLEVVRQIDDLLSNVPSKNSEDHNSGND